MFDFPLLVGPFIELNGFRHLFTSMGFVCFWDLHSLGETLKDIQSEYMNIYRERATLERVSTILSPIV